MIKRSSDFVFWGLQAHEIASEIAEMAIDHPQDEVQITLFSRAKRPLLSSCVQTVVMAVS